MIEFSCLSLLRKFSLFFFFFSYRSKITLSLLCYESFHFSHNYIPPRFTNLVRIRCVYWRQEIQNNNGLYRMEQIFPAGGLQNVPLLKLCYTRFSFSSTSSATWHRHEFIQRQARCSQGLPAALVLIATLKRFGDGLLRIFYTYIWEI